MCFISCVHDHNFRLGSLRAATSVSVCKPQAMISFIHVVINFLLSFLSVYLHLFDQNDKVSSSLLFLSRQVCETATLGKRFH